MISTACALVMLSNTFWVDPCKVTYLEQSRGDCIVGYVGGNRGMRMDNTDCNEIVEIINGALEKND